MSLTTLENTEVISTPAEFLTANIASLPSTSPFPSQQTRLRVAFVITRSDSFGGSSVHVRDLSRVLMQSGHEVMVFIGGEGPVTEAYRQAGVPYTSLKYLVRNISAKKDFLGLMELREALRRYLPDLVSTHTSKAGLLGRLAAWSLGIAAIYTPHCWSFTDGFPGAAVYRRVEIIARRFGRRIIMVSEAERQEGLKGGVGSKEHLVTVHNGMPDIPVHLHANPCKSPPRLLMVGRCEKQKDHTTLFRALARLKNLPWTLDCVGDGPLRPQLEALLRELNLTDRVNLLGYRRDVTELMSQSQAFLLITNWEGLPRSIIEAMRAGLPVVATDVGGNAEAVRHGRTGYIAQRGDVAGLTCLLREVIADSSLRSEFGAAGRQLYEEEFTLERMVSKTFHVWESVLGAPVEIKATQMTPESQVSFASCA